nr:DUF1993 domain-containing protein [Hyphomonas sp. Mor2]
MTTPIYKSTIGVMIRQAEALVGVLATGRDHLGDDADAFINDRLIDDMLPFSFQIRAVCNSAWGNIEAIRAGQAGPPPDMDVSSYAQLESMLSETIANLKTVTPEDVDAMLDKDVIFALGDFKIPFTGLGFLTSFALPNFNFHVTTAYNLLRRKGVAIGKRDFLGALDMNVG